MLVFNAYILITLIILSVCFIHLSKELKTKVLTGKPARPNQAMLNEFEKAGVVSED